MNTKEGREADLERSGDVGIPAAEVVPPIDAMALRDSYLDRLERLATAVLARRFKSAADLWSYQIKLLELQREIQAAITQEKGRRDSKERATVDALRQTLWHARRFGDALAWLLLRGERRFIYPLAHNQRSPVPLDDHGSRGVLALAEEMHRQGMGFPVLHDMTDLLRVGDLSFLRPGVPPRVVEVKTDVVAEKPVGNKMKEFEYLVAALWTDDRPPDHAADPQHAAPSGDRLLFPTERVQRQLRRMDKARLAAIAEPGQIREVHGERFITALASPNARRANWDAVRRVVRNARRLGYSAEKVHDTMLVVALYDPLGLSTERLNKFEQLPRDLIASGILFEHQPERNSLLVSSIPKPQGGPQLFLPYFLYPLPRRTIFNMMRGRMGLISLVNVGRIAASLEDAGFDVTVSTSRTDFGRDPLVVRETITDVDGTAYRTELRNLGLHLDELVMEFLSTDYLLNMVRAMEQATQQATQQGTIHRLL